MSSKPFDQHLEMIALEFLEKRSTYEKIISIHHTDADGICSGILISKLLDKLRIPYIQQGFNLEVTWEEFLPTLGLNSSQSMAVIFSDLGPSGDLLWTYANKFQNIDFIILDHHRYQVSSTEKPPSNIYNANPTLFGLHGLKEIVGSALNYLFVRQVDESMQKYAWIAIIGIAGDSLNHLDEFQSYNRVILEEGLSLEQLEKHEGICLYGAQYERIDKALATSILPFIPEAGGSQKQAKNLLQSLGIDPSIKVENLDLEDIDKLDKALSPKTLLGEFGVFPKKFGILRYPFEHAQLLSVLGSKHLNEAKNMLGRPRITAEAKKKYTEYISVLSQNLATFVSMPKAESTHAICVDLTQSIPLEFWSDTGSFASINQLYNPLKMLFIGGQTPEGIYKISVRCTPEFIAAHNQHGAVHAILAFTKQFGGSGGGHGLAGGIRLTPELYPILIQHVDKIIEGL
ncbi:MAG: hypothetical protein ACTSRK_13005 [Promethearchaeota archaeon]